MIISLINHMGSYLVKQSRCKLVPNHDKIVMPHSHPIKKDYLES